jgi:acetoin:2,6-dichlorophenolindophenol oxidoreductase subunit alpha
MYSYNEEDLKKMLLIRNVELTILNLFSEGLVKGTAHTCLGQEYIPVSLHPFMLNNDFIISNHRGHGHYLSLSEDVEGLLSEIMDKEDAVCNGIGGSQHILHKNFMSTGIQGEGIAVSTGVAWTYKYRGTGDICYVYIGDGTFGRGTVYESLNLAALHQLPLVIIAENNNIAMTTHIKDNMSGSIEGRAKAFGVDYLATQSHNLDEIRQMIKEPILRVRTIGGPLVIEFKTERVAAHSKDDDTRSKQEVKEVQERYWYNCCKKENPELLKKCEEEVTQEIETILKRIKQKGLGRWDDFEKRNNS